MARKRMVTRTVQSTKVLVMCANTETASIENYEVTVSGVFSDDAKLMKEVEKVLASETIKPVAIKEKTIEEKLYGMEEQKFIENAEVLPSRTKVDETVETKETEE